MARILITGCSTGIGRATAVELTRRGHRVIATARRAETLDELDVAERIALDVDDDAAVRDGIAAAGDIDVLVNNAGWALSGPIEKVPLDRVRAMFDTNVFGLLRVLQAAVPQMRTRGSGTIVNMSSLAGRTAFPLGGSYAATKHAVEAISEALYFELAHFGIRVRIIEPGLVATRFKANQLVTGVDEPPYDELSKQRQSSGQRLSAGKVPPGPEIVAVAIADAVESDSQQLRWPVGGDAEMVIAAREHNDFETFEALMRRTLDLTW